MALPTGYLPVCKVDQIPDPGRELVEVGDEVVALFHVNGQYYCLDDVCTHDGGPLADGNLCGYEVACPRHGARFDVRTGQALCMPATESTRCHDVQVQEGVVYIRLSNKM